jgi:outer membrane receptor protein involved in Fe transport
VIGAYLQLPGYSLTNVRVGIQSTDHWSASLFVNNVTNKHAELENLYQENEPSPAYNRIITNQPLTAGVDLTYRY